MWGVAKEALDLDLSTEYGVPRVLKVPVTFMRSGYGVHVLILLTAASTA
jgi:hypothetical protein